MNAEFIDLLNTSVYTGLRNSAFLLTSILK